MLITSQFIRCFFLSLALLYSASSTARAMKDMFGLEEMRQQLTDYIEVFSSKEKDSLSLLKQSGNPRFVSIFAPKAGGGRSLLKEVQKKAKAQNIVSLDIDGTEEVSEVIKILAQYKTSKSMPSALEVKLGINKVGSWMQVLVRAIDGFAPSAFLLWGANYLHSNICPPEDRYSYTTKEHKYYPLFKAVNFLYVMFKAFGFVYWLNELNEEFHLSNEMVNLLNNNQKILLTLHLDKTVTYEFIDDLKKAVRNRESLSNIFIIVFKQPDSSDYSFEEKWVLSEGEKKMAISVPKKKTEADLLNSSGKIKDSTLEMKLISEVSQKTYLIPEVFLGKTACARYFKNKIDDYTKKFHDKKISFILEGFCEQIPFIKLSENKKWKATFDQAVFHHVNRHTKSELAATANIMIGREDFEAAYEKIWGQTIEAMQVSYKALDANSLKTFADIAGQEAVLEELKEALLLLKQPELAQRYGLRPLKGILLYGPPGNGKTLFAKAIANESKMSFINVSTSDLATSLVGGTVQLLHDAFERARQMAPAVIFIDEIDYIASKRDEFGSSTRMETINSLLQELDGVIENPNIVLVAATNRRDSLDEAFLRPGRIDKQIFVGSPSVAGRKSILEFYCKHRPIGHDVDFNEIANLTEGYSGAQLEGLVNQAATYAFRQKSESIVKAHFEMAIASSLKSAS